MIAKIDSGAWLAHQRRPAASGGVGSDGRLVVVGTPKGDVLAFSAADGKPLWQAKVSSEVLAAPAVGDDGVAVRSGDNRFFLLDGADGKRKWVISGRRRRCRCVRWRRRSSPTSTSSSASPAASWSPWRCRTGRPSGKAPSPRRGATELDRVADVVAPRVIDGRQVCAVAFQGRIACFDLGQGGPHLGAGFLRRRGPRHGWTLSLRHRRQGAVHALDRGTGSSVWKQDKLLNRRVSAPVVRRGLVAVADVRASSISSTATTAPSPPASTPTARPAARPR